MDYYEKKHMPMMANFLSNNLKFYEIDKGLAVRTANDKIPFIAVGYFYCYNMSEYNEALQKTELRLSTIFQNSPIFSQLYR